MVSMMVRYREREREKILAPKLKERFATAPQKEKNHDVKVEEGEEQNNKILGFYSF